MLECSEFNQEYYIKLPTYQLLDLINRNDKLIEIAKERVGHWDCNKDYDAELDELLWRRIKSIRMENRLGFS